MTGRYRDLSVASPPRVGGKRPKLTEAQAAEAVARVHLGRANKAIVIAKEYGISKQLLADLVAGYRPKHWDETGSTRL